EAIKHVQFPMGADPSGKISRAFGVLIENMGLGCTEDEGMARRGTFVIDQKGIVRTMEIHDNSVGRKAAETLRKVQAAQYVESHPGNV
ncbi:redoxin domain-containing protein, partial [Klebsiella pneumoniae]|nr:redoxin domain-containing protein [Klebsiella pneumoniae]